MTRLLGMCGNAKTVYFVLELAGKGDLHTAVTREGPYTHKTVPRIEAPTHAESNAEQQADHDNQPANAPECVAFVAGEITAALAHVHGHGRVFGDLKLENVLLHDSGHIKLADFGAVRPYHTAFTPTTRSALAMSSVVVKAGADVGSATGPMNTVEGTAEYLAPELALVALSQESNTRKAARAALKAARHAQREARREKRRARKLERGLAVDEHDAMPHVSLPNDDSMESATQVLTQWQQLSRDIVAVGAAEGTPASDLWGLGCVLYASFSGGRTPAERGEGRLDFEDDLDDDNDNGDESPGSESSGISSEAESDSEPETKSTTGAAMTLETVASAAAATDTLPIRMSRRARTRSDNSSPHDNDGSATGHMSAYRAASRSRSRSASRSRSRSRRAAAAGALLPPSEDPFSAALRAARRAMQRVVAMAAFAAEGKTPRSATTVVPGAGARVARSRASRLRGVTVSASVARALQLYGDAAIRPDKTSDLTGSVDGTNGGGVTSGKCTDITDISPLPSAVPPEAVAFIAALLMPDPRDRLGVTPLTSRTRCGCHGDSRANEDLSVGEQIYLERVQAQSGFVRHQASNVSNVTNLDATFDATPKVGVSPLFALPRRRSRYACSHSLSECHPVTVSLSTAVAGGLVPANVSSDNGTVVVIGNDCELFYIDYDIIAAHPYLTKYLASQDNAKIEKTSSANGAAFANDVPAPLGVLCRLPAPTGLRLSGTSPGASTAAAAAAAAGGWARRKQSMLWAPMPTAGGDGSGRGAGPLPPLPVDDVVDLAAAALADADAVSTAIAGVGGAVMRKAVAEIAMRRAGDAVWGWINSESNKYCNMVQRGIDSEQGLALSVEHKLWQWLSQSK